MPELCRRTEPILLAAQQTDDWWGYGLDLVLGDWLVYHKTNKEAEFAIGLMQEITNAKIELIKSGKLSAEQNVKNFLNEIKKRDKVINAFLYVAEKEAVAAAKEIDAKLRKGKAGKLAGLVIAVKSNINVIGMPISCASKTLADYKGTYDADVVKKIKAEDGIIIGITNCDEFACGISGETSAFGGTKNPAAPGVVPGGSSSGSAAAVAAGFCDLALGSDTGGSIRNPTSHCGIVGVKPSYGRVSRYGLIDLSMSLDQIGPFAPDVYGAALLMEIISGKSDADATTYDKPIHKYSKIGKLGRVSIGLSNEFKKLCTNKDIYSLIEKKAKDIAKKLGLEIRDVKLKYTELGVETYYPIVYTEFFSATRKFDGRRYGKRIEDSVGDEALRRILGGAEISKAEHAGQYYRKALATKKLITQDFENAFKEVDFVIAPTTPELPHKVGEKVKPEDAYAMDAFTIPANLAGVCAGVVPVGTVQKIPVGMQIIAPAFKEELLLSFMKAVEESI